MIDLRQFLRTLLYQLPIAKLKSWYNRITRSVYTVTKLVSNPKAEAVINKLMAALKQPTDEARIQALMPIVHKSMYFRNPDGSLTLGRNITEFSLQKAAKSVGIYADPVRVKEVHRGNVMTFGTGEFAERGREDKYFVCKKDDTFCQYPAPVGIFWPDDKEEDPKITNFGSF